MRILGIDIGSTTIKALELDSAFGRYEIHEYHETPIPQGAEPEAAIAQAMAQLIASLPKKPDRVVVALKTQRITFRNLQLPTRDKKAIQSGIAFELEDELPFPADQMVYDSSVISQNKQAGTLVHVAATLKKHLAQALDQWGAGGLDVDLVTTEAWAYRSLCNRILSPATQEKPVLIAHLGHERSILYVHHKGTPVMAREIPWGGRDLTTAICQRYQIPMDQAEHAKLDHGFVIPADQAAQGSATPEQVEFSQTMMQPIQALIATLRQAELTCKSLTQQTMSTIYLTGGTSLLPGLARVIEENLLVPVKPLQALSAIATSGVTYSEQTDAAFSMSASLALCLVGPDRATAINFRKGEFAKAGRGGRELNLATLKKPLLAIGAVTFTLFLSLVIESSVYTSRMQEVDTQLERSVRSFFGSLSSSAVRTYMANTATLKQNINKELNKQKEINGLTGPNTHSPLDFLRELSTAVPRDVVVDMTQFQVGAAPSTSYNADEAGTANLTFLVSNPQVAERLASFLDKKLTGVQRGKMEEVPGPDGTSKRWKVTFTGKPTEESYGK